MDIQQLQRQLETQGLGQQAAPVHLWEPAFCGDIDISIKRDGSWHYMGSPIGRLAIVKLFASVLRKDQDKYFLVTPSEKVGIHVEDCPFIITDWQQQAGHITFTTNLGDTVIVGTEHPVILQPTIQVNEHPTSNTPNTANELSLPYVLVRNRLYARLHQNVFYQLIELGVIESNAAGQEQLMLQSGDYRFSLGQL